MKFGFDTQICHLSKVDQNISLIEFLVLICEVGVSFPQVYKVSVECEYISFQKVYIVLQIYLPYENLYM